MSWLYSFFSLFLGSKAERDSIVIATKFAAYPWRLTSGQFVKACKYDFVNLLFLTWKNSRLHWKLINIFLVILAMIGDLHTYWHILVFFSEILLSSFHNSCEKIIGSEIRVLQACSPIAFDFLLWRLGWPSVLWGKQVAKFSQSFLC